MMTSTSSHALASNPKMFISADNTFYAYVKGGETVTTSFLKVDQDEPFGTVRGDVTVTIEAPGLDKQTCTLKKDVAVNQGCNMGPISSVKTGIWKIDFAVPADAKTYQEVSPVVKWAKNMFKWNITVANNGVEQHGRLWTERYAIRQPAPASFLVDFENYYISEDGYIYKARELGYNGQISILSADGIGIRKGKDCESAYKSTDVEDTKYSPALGVCGAGYKLFFEEPAGDLPQKATTWNGKSDWVRPDIKTPSLSELHFNPDKSTDQQSGTISFFLYNFIGQYEIKVDVDNDGSFDGQSDVLIRRQMKSLSNGLQQVTFDGVDKQGQVIPRDHPIGIRVSITRVAEIHLVASDVEGRTGGVELIRLSGDNAPTNGLCWNDTELKPFTDTTMMPDEVDGRSCPSSIDGVHSWKYADDSWGNARYIDDWSYASAKLTGKSQIVYPESEEQAKAVKKDNTMLIMAIVGGFIVLVAVIVAVIVIINKKRKNNLPPPSTPNAPISPSLTVTGQDVPPSQQNNNYPPNINNNTPPSPPLV